MTHALTAEGHDASEDGTGRGTPLVAGALVKRYGKGTDSDATDTLIAGPLGGGNDGIGRRSEDDPNLVAGPTARRLTPTECERLQALPDGWTDHGPDSRRYSALGDAVTSSVAEWIGRRILARAAA